MRPSGKLRSGLVCSCVIASIVAAGQRASAEPPIAPPAPLTRVEPTYPSLPVGLAPAAADVVLGVEVGADGRVGGVRVTQSAGQAFDAAAIAAANQWTFQPATRAGAPVRSRVRLAFHFTPPLPGPGAPPAAPAPPAALQPGAADASPAPAGSAAAEQATDNREASPSAIGNRGASPQAIDVQVLGRRPPPSRGASDYQITIGALSAVPHQNASEFLKFAPGILLTNEGGEAHADQVFLRGFDAREGQDIEFTVDGLPINESGNLHGNGYSDTHFIIPEVIQSLRVLEGPYDPRQGNFAVAGSADFHLGLVERGLAAKFSTGSFGTDRMLILYGPPGASQGTFAAADLYQTSGFGQNRDGRRASVIAQYEGQSGATSYRIFGQAYISSFHTAGVIREDDYAAGRIGFYDSYDIKLNAPSQGETASRYSVAGEISHHSPHLSTTHMVYGIVRPLELRENFTGFLLDVQEQQQSPHSQRGDLSDINMLLGTIGARGSARLSGAVLGQMQEIEVGYFARGDFGSTTQQRIEAATGHPYLTDVDLDFRLGDVGLYGDLNLRPLRWLSLRGGVRGDLFTFDVNNHCAVQSVEHPTPTRPLYDASCLDQENMGAHREPNQRSATQSAVYMPRGSILVGPFHGLSATASAGQGVRSIDPIYIAQDTATPFASVTAYDGGLMFSRRFPGSTDLSLRSTVFYTHVPIEYTFSVETLGPVALGPTTRLGSASSVRVTGPFYDVAANLTYVKATLDQSGLLVPYIPDLVVRADAAIFGALPWRWARWWHKPLRGVLAAGLTYVGPRPLPYGDRSDTIVTLDASATLRWWLFEAGVSASNLLDSRYRLGEYNYASDYHSQPSPTLVPVRHFTAGAPLTALFTLAIHYGDRR